MSRKSDASGVVLAGRPEVCQYDTLQAALDTMELCLLSLNSVPRLSLYPISVFNEPNSMSKNSKY